MHGRRLGAHKFTIRAQEPEEELYRDGRGAEITKLDARTNLYLISNGKLGLRMVT